MSFVIGLFIRLNCSLLPVRKRSQAAYDGSSHIVDGVLNIRSRFILLHEVE